MCIIKEDKQIKVELVSLGEGYNGDYNENDPDDKSLFCFDIYIDNEETGTFPEIAESRCTMLPDEVEPEVAEAAVLLIFERVKHEYNGDSISHLADELSYIDIDSVHRWMKKIS